MTDEADGTGELTRNDDHLVNMLIEPAPRGLGDLVKYDFSKSTWHYWDQHRWRPDTTDKVYDMIRAKALAWIKASQSTAKIKELLPLLNYAKKTQVMQSMAFRDGIAMAGDEWDRQPNLLGVKNGVVDLDDGSFYPEPHREWLVSRSANVEWDAEAECPTFKAFLREIMSGDEEMYRYLLLTLGYSLWGHQREQQFWMWTGQGNNGKGTLARLLLHVLGDYGHKPSDELYMKTRFGATASSAPRADLLKLQGVRFSYMSEPQGGQFNDELVKAHTGDDPITARDLHAKARYTVTFRPTHTIVFLCNDLPKTDDVGTSMRRRARVIKFLEDFSEETGRMDPDLEDKLKAEAPGIFRLLVQAAVLYGQHRFDTPAKVREWSAQYIEQNDPIANFLQDACVVAPGAKAQARDLYEAYAEWATKRGESPMSQTGFGSLIAKRFERTRTSMGMVYQGIGLLSAVAKADRGDDD